MEHFWWGSVFLLNVPLVAVAIALTLLLAPPNAPNPHKHWDFPSSLYSLITLASLVLAIKSLADNWPVCAAAGVVFACGALAFARRQARLSDPLLTFDIFRSRIFSGGALTAGGAMFCLAGLELLSTQKLQLVDALSPLNAGLIISAMALSAIPTSILGGATLHHVGFLPLISGGFLFMAAGMALVVRTGGTMLPLLVCRLVLTGLGAGLAMSVSSTAIINAAPPHRAGMASGVEAVLRVQHPHLHCTHRLSRAATDGQGTATPPLRTGNRRAPPPFLPRGRHKRLQCRISFHHWRPSLLCFTPCCDNRLVFPR